MFVVLVCKSSTLGFTLLISSVSDVDMSRKIILFGVFDTEGGFF